MDIHLIALQLMAAQGLLGAFDTLYHHEITEALPNRSTARKELSIHALRASLYSLLFIGLSAWAWHGWLAVVLIAIFAIEIVLTLWDFVTEDKTRLLPATERVTHTVLAINAGAFIALLMLLAPDWMVKPTQLSWQPQGWLSVFLALCGIGVGLSGLRDGLAALKLKTLEQHTMKKQPITFCATPSRVLVTGGSGFIGQLLVKALIADGHEVIVLTRNSKNTAWNFSGQVMCITSLQQLPAHSRIDTVINLAGARILGWRWSTRRKAQLLSSRVALTEQVINWTARAEHKPKLFLSASAIGFYGVQAIGDNTELTETAAPQEIFMSQLCQHWEAAAHKASQYGVQVACMRFGLVLGHQGALPMLLLPIKLGLGGALGSGKQWLSWIHVEDLIRAIAHLWQLHTQVNSAAINAEQNINVLQPVYNFTAPQVLSQFEFSKVAAEVLHRPCFFPTPAWPMRLLLGEQADLLIEGQRVVPERLLQSGFKFLYPDAHGALQDLA
jgi:uncharacterized protein (TIGR01777 family)